MIYDGFQIETFEAGRGLWHAKIRREDRNPVMIDGVSFPELEVGFAWSDANAAAADAKTRIDYLNQRSAGVAPPSRSNRPAAFGSDSRTGGFHVVRN
jgi:hypothetical protein